MTASNSDPQATDQSESDRVSTDLDDDLLPPEDNAEGPVESVQFANVPLERVGQRLDKVLVELFPDYSRSRLQTWTDQGHVLLDGRQPKRRDKVMGGESVELRVPAATDEEWGPEEIPLDVVYQDDALLVINKPAGMVVHPGAGNYGGTLLNGLLHYAPELAAVPRAGLVHRLDKDTTGLLVVARTLKSHKDLVDQLKERSVSRQYLALINGTMVAGGTVDEPVGRHPTDRKRMAVRPLGREAITHYRINERFTAHTLLDVKLETGRTHQIRVHMAHLNHPLVGDPTYGGRNRVPVGASELLRETLRAFPRQALHARELGLIHPQTGELVSWQAPIPEDFQQLLSTLREQEQESDV